MTTPLGWAILGTGRIAKKLAKAINESTTGKLVAVGSRSQESAGKFGDEFNVPAGKRYGSYEAAITDPDVQAVYISFPNHLHAEWTIRCAQAKKHVLCEKPMAMNFAEAMTMVEAARANGVFLMEAFMYRCHPQTAKLVELLREKVIGDVRLIESSFAYNAGDSFEDIRTVNAWGGGGIVDVGTYTVSMCRLIAGAVSGKPFENPTEVRGFAHIGERTRVDEWATATLRFPASEGNSEILANVSSGMMVGTDYTVRIYGTKGKILVPSPWFPQHSGTSIIVHRAGEEKPQEIPADPGPWAYTWQVDLVARAIASGKRQVDAPGMTWDDTLGNMATLDQWRRSVGLVWDTEKAEGLAQAKPILAAKKRADASMPYGQVKGVNKPVSRVVMGTMIFRNDELPLTHAMLDHFVQVGGNCIDTAFVYAGGQSEQAVGHWIKARGNREEVVVLTKGGHTPNCYPAAITRELMTSLERLQTDYIDIYLLHRDNPELPVGEFVEVLNEHHRAGRIRAFGGSNWTTERLQAANEYAARHGRVPFTASSPNFSLARWNQPTWSGCVTASDADSRAWYTKTQMPLFSWSSQAMGFFTGRYSRGQEVRSNDWYVNTVAPTWFNDANFDRLERAQELAKKKGATATQIALAYVLNQPFPTFALIGPRTIEETRTSIEGVNLRLTAEEMRWLNLEDAAVKA